MYVDKDESYKVYKPVVSLFETKNPIGMSLVDLARNITSEDLKGPMTDATTMI